MKTLPYKTINKKYEWADILSFRCSKMKKAGRRNKTKFYRAMKKADCRIVMKRELEII